MKKHGIRFISSLLVAGCLVFTACGEATGNNSSVSGATSAPTSAVVSGNDTISSETPSATATTAPSSSNNSSSNAGSSATPSVAVTQAPVETTPVKDAEENKVEITSNFTITLGKDGGNYTQEGNTYTITSAGDYTFEGNLNEGNIIVNAGSDDKVNINLNGTIISCSTAAPIYVASADSVKIKSEEGSYNEINDNRSGEVSDADETGKAAIYADCDMSLTGKGTLVVNTSYNNGVQSKDDLSIKNVTLKVTAVNNALKGNDEVKIESGEILLISSGGDGIKTSNTEITKKGNQKGNVIISGGNVEIYACCDAIDAAYDAIIETEGNVNLYTSKYSDYTGQKVESGSTSGSSEFYLVVSSSLYDSSSKYYGYFYNDDYSAGVWAEATYSTMVSSGWTRYYGLLMKAPSGYKNAQFFVFASGSNVSTSEYAAATDYATFNSSMNAFMFKSKSSSGVISGDYTSLTTSQNNKGGFGGPGGGGNTAKSDYSAKGIKAGNEITINNGNITIKAYDDGIHASQDTMDTGATGVGNVTINGGSLTITSADDGIHAENIVTINDGNINILTAYEGVEGNVINFNGGTSYIYATDDGINACAGSSTPLINFTGGYVDVSTPSGDTDAIDSNGNIKMTGGFVLVKGGNSQGTVAGSVDVDGSIVITGGYMVALGGICELPSNSVNCYASSGTSFSTGSYELKDSNGNSILSFSLTKSYSSCWICSDKLETNGTYTLYKDGTTSVLNWTQTAGNAGSSGSSMGGFGGGGGKRW